MERRKGIFMTLTFRVDVSGPTPSSPAPPPITAPQPASPRPTAPTHPGSGLPDYTVYDGYDVEEDVPRPPRAAWSVQG
jgi:hypothetical protein